MHFSIKIIKLKKNLKCLVLVGTSWPWVVWPRWCEYHNLFLWSCGRPHKYVQALIILFHHVGIYNPVITTNEIQQSSRIVKWICNPQKWVYYYVLFPHRFADCHIFPHQSTWRSAPLSSCVWPYTDNACPHTAQLIRTLLKDFHWKQFKHPLYSPDLAPSDYHLFPRLKKERRQCFQTWKLILAVTNICIKLGEDFYCEGIEKLVTGYNKGFDKFGDK